MNCWHCYGLLVGTFELFTCGLQKSYFSHQSPETLVPSWPPRTTSASANPRIRRCLLRNTDAPNMCQMRTGCPTLSCSRPSTVPPSGTGQTDRRTSFDCFLNKRSKAPARQITHVVDESRSYKLLEISGKEARAFNVSNPKTRSWYYGEQRGRDFFSLWVFSKECISNENTAAPGDSKGRQTRSAIHEREGERLYVTSMDKW